MTDRDATDDITDLAASVISPGFALVAVVVGGAGYPLWATLAGTASAAAGSNQAVRAYLRRRANRDHERIRRLASDRMLRHLQNLAEDEDEESLDLFGEVLKNALEDDEEAKQPIYAAILDWMLAARQPAPDIRVITDAARGLSYLEVYCFIGAAVRNYTHAAHGQLLSDQLPASLTVNHMLRRQSNFGLIRATPRFDGGEERLQSLGPTRLGDILVKHCNFEELPIPAGLPSEI